MLSRYVEVKVVHYFSKNKLDHLKDKKIFVYIYLLFSI